ncbi:DUF1801 domain-containing protein [Aquiluna sp. KACHI24]|uniref:DUF1801 domain-containing protein n=1 Tax=Aquiluna sp. KACHI24 TaxID=2968831 RepID=UPI00220AB0BA|nr:DUF1801 domain-containing protein [Aquiluna sp. KACHI24]BDP99671.1 hypothetical protein AKACHI_00080 [Aquiluna sp. KACHI24]
MTETVAEEIDGIIASQPNWRGETLAELRALILDAYPEIREAVKWKMPSKPLGSPTWEANGIVCVADFLKNAVRLTFPKGAQVPDPSKLFNARLDSKVARAIDFIDGDNFDRGQLKLLIRAAVEVNE